MSNLNLQKLCEWVWPWLWTFKKLKEGTELEAGISQQAAANFWDRKLWMLKISIPTLNSQKQENSNPKFCIYKRKFSTRKKLSNRLKFRQHDI